MSLKQNEVGKRPFSGYFLGAAPAEDSVLTHVGPASPCGELMRRYWQPVAMAKSVTDRPHATRILGEDLVVFRDGAGRLGVLHKHCSHRGASLEFGRIAERGIQCCYHGWHFDIDGTILETPGEPPGSTIKDRICHGAYPALERAGLIFAYMGPPDRKPPFPEFDTLSLPGVELVPYAIHHPCSWLQVHENLMDPVHSVFLHAKMGNVQITPAWGEEPVTEWGDLDGRVTFYVATRRIGAKIWVRFNEVIVPNFGQVGGFWETGAEERLFDRVGATRWTVPGDDRTCWIFGLRHFSEALERYGAGDKSKVGYELLDLYGQTGGRPYAEMQNNPGDWEVEVSQRPIAIHGLENLGRSDLGIGVLRHQLRRAVEAAAKGEAPQQATRGADRTTPTYTTNTVYDIPKRNDRDDEALRRQIGRMVVAEVVAADAIAGHERLPKLRERLARIPQRVLAGETATAPCRFVSL